MTPQIISQKAFITQYLAAYLQEQDPSTLQTNSIVGDSLTELIRLQMREIAADTSNEWFLGNSILEKAVQQTLLDVESHFPDVSRANLDQHLERVQETLKFVAKEITDLQEKLRSAREREQVLDRRRFIDDVEVPFEMISVGTRQSLEGLMVMPIGEQDCYLNLEDLDHSWMISGEWFPFELAIGELTFIMDDEGTIFISTENLPQTLISQIRETLYQIAQRLYRTRSTFY